MQSEKSGPASDIETIIGVESELHGDISFKGQLRLDGCLHGNVQVEADADDAMIVIGAKGRVFGNINVPYVITCGEVIGNVEAGIHLKVMADALIQGDVRYGEVEMEPGARISGSLSPIYRELVLAAHQDQV